MDLGISGKTALVLGAGGGLGGAIANGLAREGANVALADIDANALKTVRAAVEQAGVRALPLTWNLGDIAVIEKNVSEIEAQLGTVDILINNTGGPPPGPASGIVLDNWVTQFNGMVLSVIKLTDRVLAQMRVKKWGRIITSASSGVVAPIPNLAVSNTLRSALVGWSKSLAREVASDGITANIVLPGRIATNRIHFLDEQKAKRENRTLEAVVAESTASIPVARYGRPEEYADVVTFLASQRASYITGSIVRVDGGYIASI